MRLTCTFAALLSGGALLLWSASAAAEIETGSKVIVSAEDPSLRPIEANRRSGMVLGMSGGPAFAGSSGYTNNARFIGNPNYYSSSPLMPGWSANFHLMGAITDYLTFGPDVTVATFETADWKSTGYGIGFRGELYPLISVVPAFADTAVFAQVGVGSSTLRAKGPYPDADGTQSFFGFGLQHEWRLGRLLGGHAAAGPMIEYDLIRAESIERHWLTVGLRVVWYAGRVKLDH